MCRRNWHYGRELWQMTQAEYAAMFGGRWNGLAGEPFQPDGYPITDEASAQWCKWMDDRKRLIGPLTPDEIVAGYWGPNGTRHADHRWVLLGAMREGKTIPAEVLRDYPELTEDRRAA